jgi:serine/threonine protein kinase
MYDIRYAIFHSAILSILDTRQRLESPEHVIIVLELVNGVDLQRYLQSRGRLSNDDARNVFAQIVNAVQHAHLNKIIHRDLKLENIL